MSKDEGDMNKPKWGDLLEVAEDETRETLRAIPKPLRDKVRGIVVSYEPYPGKTRETEGLASDTMGVFVGRAFPDEVTDTGMIPPQIVLFLRNIWEESGGDEEIYRDEVVTTILHEIGHYLGLDEEDLYDRELE